MKYRSRNEVDGISSSRSDNMTLAEYSSGYRFDRFTRHDTFSRYTPSLMKAEFGAKNQAPASAMIPTCKRAIRK
jgi:hypothetical protein